jgi:hypothetical protein
LFAKAPVLAVVVVAVAVGYFFGKGLAGQELSLAGQELSLAGQELSLAGQELSVANERISFLADQVAAYKDRLQGATPDQAAKELSTLRQQLGDANDKLQMLLPDTPRRLTEQQRTSLHAASDWISQHVKTLYLYAWSSGDSMRYAGDFRDQFNKDHVLTEGPILTSCDGKQRGILVGLRDPDRPSEDAMQFTRILQEAGFIVSYTKWETNQEFGQDFDLFICGAIADSLDVSSATPIECGTRPDR